ncbi:MULTISPECIES: hypothetical protein [unclassified Arthrobacter]|uniref:hypothetical protein n=1 Tax=unclassified Arthrobacter TaxID=235627 RepID=UPI001E5C8A5D|nr:MULTISPECIES: hypothetical protein [unclassified Arthrobacter]MCC9145263.1 hypothetical protein [Arthrobacter sp. zg-Y919]MDK1276491.1 hypothetical protein [Arthrobacter sp. zg.Y919]MDM7989134.1 hypothetical protein [Arthrobacter sp. zg-Y877]WIB01913.1 hypothetical protein QNO10_07890 [Arthrobacter sp. zg-Y919]
MSNSVESWPHLAVAWLVQSAAAAVLAVSVVVLQLWIFPETVQATVLLALILGSAVMLLLSAPLFFDWLRNRFQRPWVVLVLTAAATIAGGCAMVVLFVLGFGLLVTGF